MYEWVWRVAKFLESVELNHRVKKIPPIYISFTLVLERVFKSKKIDEIIRIRDKELYNSKRYFTSHLYNLINRKAYGKKVGNHRLFVS